MSHHDDVIEKMQAALRATDTSLNFVEAITTQGTERALVEHQRRVAVALADAVPPGTVKVDSRFAAAVEVGRITFDDMQALLLCEDGTESRFGPDRPGRLFFVPEVG